MPIALKRVVVLFAALTVAGPTLAAEQVLTLDPEAAEVTFDLSATGHDVHGTLRLLSGEIRFDPETGEASGSLEIDATSSKTGSKSRDKTMHKEVLKSEGFPLFVYRPRSVEGTVAMVGESSFTLHGTLQMLGVDHPLDLVTTARFQGDQVEASTSFQIPYVAWGMHDPSILFLRVGKEVEVRVSASGMLKPAAQLSKGAAR